MTKIRFLIVSAGSAALLLGGGTAFANVGALSGNADSHGDAVASAARTTCPHGPGGVHGACVSAIASGNSESANNTEDGAGDTNEDAAAKSHEGRDKSHGHAAKNADKAHGNSDSN
jgi:hypothetical protein